MTSGSSSSKSSSCFATSTTTTGTGLSCLFSSVGLDPIIALTKNRRIQTKIGGDQTFNCHEDYKTRCRKGFGSLYELVQKDIGYSSDADMSDGIDEGSSHHRRSSSTGSSIILNKEQDEHNKHQEYLNLTEGSKGLEAESASPDHVLSSDSNKNSSSHQQKARQAKRRRSCAPRPWSFHGANAEWSDWDYYLPPPAPPVLKSNMPDADLTCDDNNVAAADGSFNPSDDQIKTSTPINSSFEDDDDDFDRDSSFRAPSSSAYTENPWDDEMIRSCSSNCNYQDEKEVEVSLNQLPKNDLTGDTTLKSTGVESIKQFNISGHRNERVDVSTGDGHIRQTCSISTETEKITIDKKTIRSPRLMSLMAFSLLTLFVSFIYAAFTGSNPHLELFYHKNPPPV